MAATVALAGWCRRYSAQELIPGHDREERHGLHTKGVHRVEIDGGFRGTSFRLETITGRCFSVRRLKIHGRVSAMPSPIGKGATPESLRPHG